MRDVLAAVGQTAFAKILAVLVQFAAATILTRNLSAADYGIVGFAAGMVALLVRVNSLGLTKAVIRSRQLEQTTLDTAATLNTILSIVAFACAQVVAPLAGWILGTPAATLVVRVLAFRLLMAPIVFLSDCVLSREMRFGELRTGAVLGVIVRGFVSVTLALTGWKYWSLVFGTLADLFATNTVIRIRKPVRFRYNLDRSEARRLLAFGVPLTLSGLVSYVVTNADNWVVGSALGVTALGYYAVAFTWSTYASTAIQEVVQLVLFPKFAQLQSQPTRVKDAYLRVLWLVTWASAFLNMCLFVGAEGFLVNWLGNGTARWLPATGSLQVLCIYGIVRASLETAANPIMALGQANLLLKAQGLSAFVEILCLPLVAVRFGITGVAVVVTVASALQYAVCFPFLRGRLGIRARDLAAVFGPIAAAAVVGVGLAVLVPVGNAIELRQMLLRLSLASIGFLATHEILTRGHVLSECRAIVCVMLDSRR